MDFKFFLQFCLIIISGSLGNSKLTLRNNCPFSIWPGIQGKLGHPQLEFGGFHLPRDTTWVIQTPDDWAGRIWGRTQCNFTAEKLTDLGLCETGDCGNGKIKCNGAPGALPVTYVELILRGPYELDHYKISIVDGFNLPIEILPISGFSTRNDKDMFDCKPAGCRVDLIHMCSPKHAIKKYSQMVACWTVNDSAIPQVYNTTFTCRSSSNIHYLITFCP